ncbi:hypothetical protein V1511DRAFT_490802 [Dipodascopsis uninucleata]
MGFLTDHPYTAVTVTIDRLVTDEYDEDDLSGVFELIEAIRLQPTGPTEAARAIRKKLKYGSVHNQLRALTILDALIENGGKKFQSSFEDEPLLERMRILATDSSTDRDVKKKLSGLFVKWKDNYSNVPGMSHVVQLYKQLPQRKRPIRQHKPQRFASIEDDMDDNEEDIPPPKPSRPGASSSSRSASRSKGLEDDYDERVSRAIDRASSDISSGSNSSRQKSKSKSTRRSRTFDLTKEKPKLLQALAEAGTAATNLQNSLKLINRQEELATSNERATEHFNQCRLLRRQILRYIQYIESEDYIGSLIHANEELVSALQLYDRMSQPIEDDSDSEGYDSESSIDESIHNERHAKSAVHSRSTITAESLAHKRKPPPIPVKSASLSEEFKAKMALKDAMPKADDENPFGDSYKIETPAVEKSAPSWT